VFYGGMTYWWATNPTLRITRAGAALTATAGGFGADRNDPGIWRALADTPVTLLTFGTIPLDAAAGFTAQPRYHGETVTPPAGSAAQERTGVNWGSFPQSLIGFLDGPGQASYWYSSGHQDYRKPPFPVAVAWTAADAVVPPGADPSTGVTTPTPTAPVNEPLPPYAPVPAPSAAPDAPASPAGSASPAPSGSGSPSVSPSASASPGATDAVPSSPPSPTLVPPNVPQPNPYPAAGEVLLAPEAGADTPGAAGVARFADLGEITTYGLTAMSLVPDHTPAPDRRAWLTWGVATVMALTAVAIAGFGRGWLALPWRRRASDDDGPHPSHRPAPSSGGSPRFPTLAEGASAVPLPAVPAPPEPISSLPAPPIAPYPPVHPHVPSSGSIHRAPERPPRKGME
jgi:hypothetical protein